ncbi:MAG: sigma 54-interacting transcriptional regulator [Negativicutes bacterium]|nr:sigma 54-interacting transcriptional regulator [Negativicutes bacterium]
MGKITFVIPYPEIRPVVESIFEEQQNGEWELEIILSMGVKGMIRHNIVSDVVVARGVTAAALKRVLPDTPTVELQVSGYDIMRAIKECQQRFGARRIGIVGSEEMLYGAKGIEEIMPVELVVVPVRDEDDAEQSIRDLKSSGIDIIIGGVMSTGIADRLGISAVFVQSGREAIYHALREAKRVAAVRRQEQERGEQFRAILNYSSEGVIAVDARGMINLVNTAAVNLTALREDAIGRHSERMVPQFGLDKVLADSQGELGEIITINGQQMAVNKVPIIVGEDTVGAVATFQPVAAIQELEGKIREKIYRRGHVARQTFADVLGESPAIRRVVAMAHEFSKVNSNVLIVGETGTGKEVFAQSIHNASSRGRGPFVAVNCAALPENLLESELFGYTEGAFTGAVRGGKIGLFEQAHRGTIFLDEISEISPKLQGRLLRVLQEREIMRLGDDRVVPVDLRIIAATNRELYALMQEGAFRQDLYYRLDILRLILPPLRQRREDIIPLFRHFLRIYCLRFNKAAKEINPAAEARLAAHDWPGNVRELRNIAERLAVLSGGSVIDEPALAGVLPPGGPLTREVRPTGDLNQDLLLKALADANYHYGKAAAMLGISRTTLWRRLKDTAARNN